MSNRIKNVSIERVQAELTKTLLSPHPELVTEFQETGIFIEILPELNRVLSSKDSQIIRPLLHHVPATTPMRYAALLSTLDHIEAKKVMKALRLDNNTIDNAAQIIRYTKEEEKIPENEYGVRKAMSMYGPRLLEDLFTFADAKIQTTEDVTGLTMRGRRIHLRTIKRYCEEIISRGDCVTKKAKVSQGVILSLANTGAQIAGLEVGEERTIEELLYLTMVYSACDAGEQVLKKCVKRGQSPFDTLKKRPKPFFLFFYINRSLAFIILLKLLMYPVDGCKQRRY